MHGTCFACTRETDVVVAANTLWPLCTPCLLARIPACAPGEHAWRGTKNPAEPWGCLRCHSTMTAQEITLPKEEPNA